MIAGAGSVVPMMMVVLPHGNDFLVIVVLVVPAGGGRSEAHFDGGFPFGDRNHNLR